MLAAQACLVAFRNAFREGFWHHRQLYSKRYPKQSKAKQSKARQSKAKQSVWNMSGSSHSRSLCRLCRGLKFGGARVRHVEPVGQGASLCSIYVAYQVAITGDRREMNCFIESIECTVFVEGLLERLLKSTPNQNFFPEILKLFQPSIPNLRNKKTMPD